MQLFPTGVSYDEYFSNAERFTGKMKAIYEEMDKLLDPYQDVIQYINKPMKVAVFAESWCGDCANAIPVISKLAEVCNNWEYRLISKDKNLDIFSQYYTTAGKSKIPLVLFLTPDGYEINRWAERPAQAYKVLTQIKKEGLHGDELKERLRSIPELNVPVINKLILEELIHLANKSVAVLESIQ